MSVKILDGQKLASLIEAEVKKEIEDRRLDPPRLAILTDHSDPASEVYMRSKIRASERCGIQASIISLPEGLTFPSIASFMNDVQREYNAVILQLPIHRMDAMADIIHQIKPSKDVDGLNATNVGCLHMGDTSWHKPCTPSGIIELLKHYDIPTSGKHAVIIGRSNLVGRPLAELLLQEDATVTVCHSRSGDLSRYTKDADILISAVGKPKLITADMVKPDAVVVDVGINRVEGKLCGDVDFEAVKEKASWITPVPGGVGPMTVAMLMRNTLKAALYERKW